MRKPIMPELTREQARELTAPLVALKGVLCAIADALDDGEWKVERDDGETGADGEE